MGDRGCVSCPGYAEVGYLRIPSGAQEDILRLYVAVDYAALMGSVKGLRDLQRERGGDSRDRAVRSTRCVP